jgi:hypothetical protein
MDYFQERHETELEKEKDWRPVGIGEETEAEEKRNANATQRQLFARSERVKGIDFHPVEPWILTTLYSGTFIRHIIRKAAGGKAREEKEADDNRTCLYLEL